MNVIDNLTPDLARHRILGASEAAKFWGVSLPTWRRFYRVGSVPKPIKLGERKLGWQLGILIEALEARSKGAA
jgi:prophage regulatory protein